MKPPERTRFLLLVLFLEIALAAALASSEARRQSADMGSRARLVRSTPVTQTPAFKALKKFTFENAASLSAWEEKVFKNKTLYTVARSAQRGFLKSVSKNASSGLYTKLNFEVSPDLILSWRWRVITFPQKKIPTELANRRQDDFAARIYVIFPGSNLFNSDVIEYIWDEHVLAGTVGSSPYSERIKLFVVRSGKPEGDGWRNEERNIYEDYERLFGKKPKRPLGAIALMSDSDNTASVSEADFGEIILKSKKSESPPRAAL